MVYIKFYSCHNIFFTFYQKDKIFAIRVAFFNHINFKVKCLRLYPFFSSQSFTRSSSYINQLRSFTPAILLSLNIFRFFCILEYLRVDILKPYRSHLKLRGE